MGYSTKSYTYDKDSGMELLKDSQTPYYKQIANNFRNQIVSGELLYGFRLPS